MQSDDQNSFSPLQSPANYCSLQESPQSENYESQSYDNQDPSDMTMTLDSESSHTSFMTMEGHVIMNLEKSSLAKQLPSKYNDLMNTVKVSYLQQQTDELPDGILFDLGLTLIGYEIHKTSDKVTNWREQSAGKIHCPYCNTTTKSPLNMIKHLTGQHNWQTNSPLPDYSSLIHCVICNKITINNSIAIGTHMATHTQIPKKIKGKLNLFEMLLSEIAKMYNKKGQSVSIKTIDAIDDSQSQSSELLSYIKNP